MISEDQFKASAYLLGVEVATIKAVSQVESTGSGLLNGKPIILFEPHVFWKRLKKKGITPVRSEICYPFQGTKPYPRGQAAQWKRVEEAVLINREAALESCSWGMFQIMGFNWPSTHSKSLQKFINRMYKGEGEQLNMFVEYIMHEYMDDELREKNFDAFARQYNGPLWYKNNYGNKLRMAYARFAKEK